MSRLVCALVYIGKRAEQKAADLGTSSQRCRGEDEAPAAPRWRLEIATPTPRHCCAGSSVTPHKALAVLLRWRIGVVALVHVGIAALRLRIAALARRNVHVAIFFCCWVSCML
jgi:hypothetical protein